LYPIVALLGAAPLIQAWIGLVARGSAAGFVAWLGRLADRSRQRVVRLATVCAAGGVVLLVISRSAIDWAPAALGVAMAEIGSNGIAGAIKQSLARGEDPVRRTQVGFAFRFAGFGTVPLVVDGLWAILSRKSVRDAQAVVAVLLIVLLLVVVAIVPRLVRRPGGHPLKASGDGVIYLTTFAAAARADRTWLHVWAPGQARKPRWAFFDLRPGALLTVVDRASDTCLLEFRCRPRQLRPAGRHRRQARNLRAGPFRRPLWILAGGPRPRRAVGSLRPGTVRDVTVSLTHHRSGRWPQWLQDALKGAPRVMIPEIDAGQPVVTYVIESDAFGTAHGPASLRINSHVLRRELTA
jgi:hypothetical protein